jgi:hypothetical protein
VSEQVFNWDQMLWFEEIWRDREERVYTELFGPLPGSVIPLKIEALRAILGPNATINDEWLHFAVIEIAPNDKHPDWLYVTSAFSQPWKIEDPAELNRDGISGFGYELLVRSPERAGWAVDVLHRLTAYQIGVYYELMRGKLFDYYDWMPLNGPISPRVPNSPVRGMFITHPLDFEEHFELRSGRASFLQIVGITGAELAFGLYQGMSRLERVLYEQGVAPTTDPARASIQLSQNYNLPPQLAGKF